MRFCALLLVLVAVLLGRPAAAQPVDPGKITQTINLFGTVAVYPAASWQRSANPTADSEYHRDQKGPTFILEQIPKGEKFDKWSRLYAVFAIQMPGLAFKDFVAQTLQPFFNACGKENFSVTGLQQYPDGVLLRVLCQNSPQGPAQFGYGEGVGEVTLIRFGQVGSTSIKIYQHWRGKDFTAANPATWPVPAEELDAMVQRFGMIRLIGKPG